MGDDFNEATMSSSYLVAQLAPGQVSHLTLARWAHRLFRHRVDGLGQSGAGLLLEPLECIGNADQRRDIPTATAQARAVRPTEVSTFSRFGGRRVGGAIAIAGSQ